MIEDIRLKSGAYQLGYKDATAPKTSINYREKMSVPINSFSHPERQVAQYIKGWKDGGR